VPMKPQVVAHELDRLLAADAIVATDPSASALSTSATTVRLMILRDVADIGGPQLRRRL